MTLPIENPNEVNTLEIQELWKYTQILKQEQEIDNTTYNKIKNGIKITIPIWYFTEEWYELYPSSKKAKIHGYGKIPIETFMQEIEERETLMKTTIIQNLTDESPTEPRVR